jgi:acyl carrier protein
MLIARGNGKLSFDEFRRILASELQVDEERLLPEASLYTDLNVDSVHAVDTMLRLEDKGIEIPLELAWQIDTVDDAYQVMIYNSTG